MDRSLRDRDSCLGETRLREQTKAVVRDAGVGAGYALVLGAGNGELPCVGRLVIEQVAGLRSVGIYTGRILWEAPVAGLGSYYNDTSHQYGANGTHSGSPAETPCPKPVGRVLWRPQLSARAATSRD